ncbi:MAG: hypothetical protein KDD45_01165 [Bdellovibrionales bacterium]|nr:hypothetical protein [Bdellovibrionales bacterium]
MSIENLVLKRPEKPTPNESVVFKNIPWFLSIQNFHCMGPFNLSQKSLQGLVLFKNYPSETYSFEPSISHSSLFSITLPLDTLS